MPFRRSCVDQPPGYAEEEEVDLMILGRADWDLCDATYFEEGAGLVTFASLEPWAHEQLDMLKLEPGIERLLGPYFSTEQLIMMYKVCLERGIFANARQLVERAYRGEGLRNASHSLRVGMHVSAVKEVEPEPQESASGTGVTVQASAPLGGADSKGGETVPKTEDDTASGPAAAKYPVKEELPKLSPMH